MSAGVVKTIGGHRPPLQVSSKAFSFWYYQPFVHFLHSHFGNRERGSKVRAHGEHLTSATSLLIRFSAYFESVE